MHWPSFLYKRPVFKINSSYRSALSKSNTNKSAININTNEEEQFINNNLALTSRAETNKHKFKYIYSNFGNFKKIKENINNKYSTNYRKIGIRKKNFNLKDDNSSFLHNKYIDSKIFPNYNNTCNISLNHHFYNFVDKNYSSSNFSIEGNNMEDKFSNNIKNQNYGFMSKIRNSYNQYNRNNNNKKHNIYLNSFNKKFPNNILKDINNSYGSLYNNINSFFPNNIISRTNKKNIINLIVNPNEQNYNINKTTNLENYVNFRIKTGERKNKDKINLTDNMFDNIYRDSYQKINNINDKNFKYKKKIININNLIRKNDNKHYQSTLKYSIPFSNYKAHIIPVNKYQEQDNTNNKSMYFKENKNNINNSYRLKKIERPYTQRNANSSRTKNIKDKSNDIENYHSFFHLSNLCNNNKRINVDLNPKCKYKRIDNNNSLEKNKLSFSNLKFFPLISKNNNYSKKIKINKNINMINSTFDKNNHSSLKLKDISNIVYTNNNSFLNIKNEMSKENINKSNIIKLED